jgi:hypothetical protein
MGTATARFRTRGLGFRGQTACCRLPALRSETSLAAQSADALPCVPTNAVPPPASLPLVLFPLPSSLALFPTRYLLSGGRHD